MVVTPGNDISLVDEWSVTSAPTLVLVEDGQEVAGLAEGFQGGDDVEASVQEHTARVDRPNAWGIDLLLAGVTLHPVAF